MAKKAAQDSVQPVPHVELPLVSFLDLHKPLFMAGVNLGDKLDIKRRSDIRMEFDIAQGVVWVYFKGLKQFIPLPNIGSGTMLQDQAVKKPQAPLFVSHPEVSSILKAQVETPSGPVDHGDAEAHRAAVRAASANANRPAPRIDTTHSALIEASRQAAQGIKAQVSEPTRPAMGQTGLQGKPKAINHAELREQIAKEMKETP